MHAHLAVGEREVGILGERRPQEVTTDALAICVPVCNPLDAEACPDGSACYPVGSSFHCAPDASGNAGVPGDACAFINVCNPGTYCATGAAVPDCVDNGCCSAFCTLGDDDACLPGQSCVAYYEDGAAPDDCLGEVGVCSSP